MQSFEVLLIWGVFWRFKVIVGPYSYLCCTNARTLFLNISKHLQSCTVISCAFVSVIEPWAEDLPALTRSWTTRICGHLNF